MNAPASSPPDQFLPRPLPGRGIGVTLAVLAHAVLVLGLALAVNWRSSQQVAAEAELWAEVPRAAAPRAVEPPPDTRPEPPPPPPRAKPVATRPAPPPPREAEDAQIAVEKARREKKEREEREDKERKQEEARKKAKAEAEEKKKAEQEKAEAEKKLAAQKAAKEKEEQAKAKADEEKQRREQEQRTAAAREAQLKRIQGLAGGSGAPTSTGSSAQSAGPSASYAGRISAYIKPRIVFSEVVSGNPAAEVEVRVAPDGRIMSHKLVRSSGVKAWDDAVQRAIERTEVLPRDTDGRVPSSMQLLFRPQD